MKQLIAKVAILSMLFFMSVPSLHAQSDAKGKDVPAKSSTEMKDVSLQQPKGKPITAAERQQEQQADEADNEDVSASAVSASSQQGNQEVEKQLNAAAFDDSADLAPVQQQQGFHQLLKSKFIEGNAGFMSLVALALVLGLAFCIERIIYLSLSEIDAKRFMVDLDGKISQGDIDGAKSLCRETRGPVASICYQGLARINEGIDTIERSVASYGAVQSANLEKGCSWITLFIAMAPSLGFLGTVIGMVMAFDQIQQAGDISPTIVAAGMKVALITTIFGIIVALVLQVFYNYILSKIEHITSQMEESAITLLDAIMRHKQEK